ncbi:hypothetical protein [Streptomyces sp. AC154]|uniref:hypothetical protein n=1 Tax=Streptomyces sp. AC154 TaxID=3143184 RepID=UPI003F7D7ACD
MAPVAVFTFVVTGRLVHHTAVIVYPAYGQPRPTSDPGAPLTAVDAISAVSITLTAVLTLVLVRRAAATLGTLYGVKAGTYLRLAVWTKLIHKCADVVRAPRIRDEHYWPSVGQAVARVYGARAMRGTVGFTYWRRRKALREHAYRVADVLRSAEIQLDADPKQGARQIARLALVISTRYAEGRVGALLDPSDIEAQPASRRFEAVRLGVVVLGAAGIVLATPALGMPAQLAVPASVLVVAAVYRTAALPVLGALSFLYPLLIAGK